MPNDRTTRNKWVDPKMQERLEALYQDMDMPLSVIADKMSEEFGIVLTRNGVIGRVHRTELAKKYPAVARERASHVGNFAHRRPGQGPELKAPKPRKTPKPHKTPKVNSVAVGKPAQYRPPRPGGPNGSPDKPLTSVDLADVQDHVVPVDRLVLIDELTDKTCRYPNGLNPPYQYCGRRPISGLPYCADHCKIVYTEPRGRVLSAKYARRLA